MARLARRRARDTALAAVAAARLAGALVAVLVATVAFGLGVPTARAAASVVAAPAPLANLAHLDFLLDEATPPVGVPGHTTYRLGVEPHLVAPWAGSSAREDGTFERAGDGDLDPATGRWEEGAYSADDIGGAAVVYLRHWSQTGGESSRESAYQLLRSVAYLQSTGGRAAGSVVSWMQADGTLGPAVQPAESPSSGSGQSRATARAIWAFGEGYAAFQTADPAFAAFLEERLSLSLGAVERDALSRYGRWAEADGMAVPAWLIGERADASAEAALGLAARVAARPDDERAATALRELAEGIGAMSAGSDRGWPYGAILPAAQSPVTWHAEGSLGPAALAAASVALDDPSLAAPAIADAAVFTPTLLTAGGPDNGWSPTPTDRAQSAQGADARVQSLLAVADATGSRGFASLAAMQAAWFFGVNHAGARMYDPATGVTLDGLRPDGAVDRDSGAASTIHGLLTALALDARPESAKRAASLTSIAEREGLEVVEAEAAVDTDGAVSAPDPSTGESSASGGALTLSRGQHAVFDIGSEATRRWVEPVVFTQPGAVGTSLWRSRIPLGLLRVTGPAQGISPAPGALAPHSLPLPVAGDRGEVRVDVVSGSLTLDALIVRPLVSRLTLRGPGGRTELVHSAAQVTQLTRVGGDGARAVVRIYDDRGALVRERIVDGATTVLLPPGGFAIAEN
jgi:hypothetical protein